MREKYAANMADGPDRRAFDVVSAPVGTSGQEFQDVARRVASVDTLNTFLRDMRARCPDAGLLPDDSAAKAAAPPAVPAKGAIPKAAAPDKAVLNAPTTPTAAASPLPPKAPDGVPLKPDPSPTGSIPRLPRAKTSGR